MMAYTESLQKVTKKLSPKVCSSQKIIVIVFFRKGIFIITTTE